jgi:hypothetical protein
MKIPENNDERFEFFIELREKCAISRKDRVQSYATQRSFFMFGAGPEGSDKVINKIYPHLDQLAGLMYSSETTRFSIDLPPSASDLNKEMIPPLMQKLNETWHLSNADLVFGQALLWSFVYGSMFVKIRVGHGGQLEPYVVEPHDIGVLREDVCGLWKQEAFTHSYWVTKSQLETQLKEIEHPRVEAIMKNLSTKPKENSPETQQILSRLETSASTPNVIGNVNFDLNTPARYRPRVAEELVQMHELYVWNDEIADYQVVTMADPGLIIFDRPLGKMFLKNEPPFIQVCPNPAHDFFWGHSEVDKLIPLQRMRNERFNQVQHMMNLQARPPKFGSGFQGDVSEIMDTMDSPSGLVVGDMPGAKLETVSPQIPDDLFREIREIDTMFEEMSGITNVIQGKGESGVRSQGHAANLARLGSSRAKKRALIIEDQLEKVATLFLQLTQAYDTDRMRDSAGNVFIAEQFTNNFIVKVDAHSNSPIFQEDQRALAFELFKAKAIDRESLLDLLDVPMKELLKTRLKTKIEPAEARAAQAEQQASAQGKKGSK